MRNKLYIGERAGYVVLCTTSHARWHSTVLWADPDKHMYYKGPAWDDKVHDEDLIKSFVRNEVIWGAE